MKSSLRNYKIIADNATINVDGLIESNCELNGNISGRFVIRSYTRIASGCSIQNCLIGRFTTVESNVRIGELRYRFDNLSNHCFAYGEKCICSDEYLDAIRSRYYYERYSYSFIGNDVYIGRNTVILEGVTIGNGAFIYPNTVIISDVPPYAIVAGSPGKVIGFRFDKKFVDKLDEAQWWNFDILNIIKNGNKSTNTINYVNNLDLINQIHANISGCKTLDREFIYINTTLKVCQQNKHFNMITGPSHIDIWYRKYNQGLIEKPKNYHLFPIPAVSLFSDNLINLIEWWAKNLGNVVLFVPDFRIGNVAVKDVSKRGRFIDPSHIDKENSMECYRLGISNLKKLSKLDNVKLWFWCLFGREVFNKIKGRYMENGVYKHPIWNYESIFKEFSDSTIDIRKYFINETDLVSNVVDSSIHPTDECYKKLANIFDNLEW